MATRFQAIEAQAMKLDLKSRARLVKLIILSLDIPTQTELGHLWTEEAERRVQRASNWPSQGASGRRGLSKNPASGLPKEASLHALAEYWANRL